MEGGGQKNRLENFNDYFFSDIVPTLKEKISQSRFPPPTYNLLSHKIFFAGVEIKIPYNSDQNMLCKTLFANKASLHKEWSWDEVLEKWNDPSPNKGWRTIYNAGREINNKVSSETTIKDLLLVKKLTIAVNPRYADS